MSDTFYFVAFADRERKSVHVIDLGHSVSYERDEFAAVNDEDFSTLEEAIAHAKALAEKYKLGYKPFQSRYNSSLNERLVLTLD
ncbi:hypothetical protein [Pseudomonas putida]|uniref:Uncharacterized protein n=1 Tax=Pseudomonas putida TaxID=303 RepID=A0A8I1JK48_PSEPU|nr:hypothetical protein [Pseudomonas putida]MBI6883075.1 hypothetical protein [Pseudomonas putida]